MDFPFSMFLEQWALPKWTCKVINSTKFERIVVEEPQVETKESGADSWG